MAECQLSFYQHTWFLKYYCKTENAKEAQRSLGIATNL